MLACRKCLFDDPLGARRPQGKDTFCNYCTTFCTRASALSSGRRGHRPSFVAFQRPHPLLCDLLRFSRESEKLPTCKEGARCKNAGERGLSVRPSVVRPSLRLSAVCLWAPKSPKAEQCHEQSRRSIIRETFSFFSLERGKIARRVTTTTKEGNSLLWLAFSSCYSQAAATGRKSLASGTFTPPSPIYKADCSK